MRELSRGSEQEVLSACGPQAFHCSGSCRGARALECAGFSSCGTRAPWSRLVGSVVSARRLRAQAL